MPTYPSERKSWWEDGGTSRHDAVEASAPLVGELRLKSRPAPAPRYALAVSLGIHGLVLIGLLTSPVTSNFGASGTDLGTGMPVALVSGFAAGGAKIGPVESEPPEAEAEAEPLTAEEAQPLDVGSDLIDLPKPNEDQEAARPPMRAAIALADLGQAANAFDGAVGADDAQGGDPTATSDLLGQIARCLPPDFRPRLAFSQLTLSVDANGRLNTAPVVTSALPQLSPADRAAADRVVQAALLCGPYSHPDAVSRVIVLPADFSGIAPTV